MKGFVPVQGYEGLYSINDKGGVYGHYRRKYIVAQYSKSNFHYHTLCKNGKIKKYGIKFLINKHFPDRHNYIIEKMKKVKNYENIYWIDIEGNIYNNVSHRWVKKTTIKLGYRTCMLCKNGKVKSYRISRLIAEHYLIKNNE